MSQTLILFLVAGAIGFAALGLMVGRVTALRGFTWTLKDVIGVALISAFIAVLFILFWKEIPKSNEQLIVYMLGQLSGFVGGVISSHYVHKAGEEKQEAARQETLQLQARATEEVARAATAAASTTPGDGDNLKAGDTVSLQPAGEEEQGK